MHTTKSHRMPLPRHQTTSEARGTNPRILERRVRVAFGQLIAEADRRPDPRAAWDDVFRAQPRCAMPYAKERGMIHAAIEQGATTSQAVVEYHLARLADDLAQFDDVDFLLSDVLTVQLMREQAEAMEAQARAIARPTDENRQDAVRETEEAITVQRLAVVAIRRGLLSFSRARA